MTNIDKLRAHPKVRDVRATDDELHVRLKHHNPDADLFAHESWGFFGNPEDAAAEALAELDGDDT